MSSLHWGRGEKWGRKDLFGLWWLWGGRQSHVDHRGRILPLKNKCIFFLARQCPGPRLGSNPTAPGTLLSASPSSSWSGSPSGCRLALGSPGWCSASPGGCSAGGVPWWCGWRRSAGKGPGGAGFPARRICCRPTTRPHPSWNRQGVVSTEQKWELANKNNHTF